MFSFGQQRKHHGLHPTTQPTTTTAVAVAVTAGTTGVGIPTTTDVVIVVVIIVVIGGGGVLSGVDNSGGGVGRVGRGFHAEAIPYGCKRSPVPGREHLTGIVLTGHLTGLVGDLTCSVVGGFGSCRIISRFVGQ